MSLEPTLFQTESRLRELRAEAARGHLAALASCCRPSAWRAALAAVRGRRTAPACT